MQSLHFARLQAERLRRNERLRESTRLATKNRAAVLCSIYSEKGFSVKDSDGAPSVICHYLECSPEELGETTWCSCGNKWCNVITMDGVGAGKLNTKHILTATHYNANPPTSSNCAAYACSRYTTETTNEGEWYLPSKFELNLIYEAFQKIGKIVSDEWYWSSLQYNDYYALCMRLSNGSVGRDSGGKSWVLAVRAF